LKYGIKGSSEGYVWLSVTAPISFSPDHLPTLKVQSDRRSFQEIKLKPHNPESSKKEPFSIFVVHIGN